MSSLRTRLLTGVLVLSAAGLVALGAVTYAEQRSFLQGRVDQEALSAWPALSRALDAAGYTPGGAAQEGSAPGGAAQEGSPPGGAQDGSSPRGEPPGAGGRGAGPGRAPVNLPPGTYGQRRDASGRVLGSVTINYSSSEATRPAPKLPANVPVGRLFTVDAVAPGGLRYRAYVRRDPEDSGLTVAAVPLSEVDQTLHRLLLVEALVIAAVLAALGLMAFFVVRLGLRPLDRMEVTAGEIAAGRLSRRVSPAEPGTEVGRLGLALNAMLDRLEEAFSKRAASEERLRRFLADASHELRTPLASIRGYAELFRMGAARDEKEVRLAMRRIEEESVRMGTLVEDLLTLARLDETRELQRQPVDLAALARDAVTDARATAADRAIEARGARSATVSGDPHQLHQVLANLLRNALVHTPAGSAIEVSVAVEGPSVSVAVRDHGPGLPAGSPERLFERFWRAEGGRERGRAGAGLGLAIAREIVEAHGGTITAADAAGGGAQFVVTLPLAASVSQQAPSRP